MGALPGFRFETLGAGLQTVFVNAWTAQVTAAASGFVWTPPSAPIVQTIGDGTFFGVDFVGGNGPALGTVPAMPRTAKFGFTVSLRAIAQSIDRLWNLFPLDTPVRTTASLPERDPQGTLKFEDYDLTSDGKSLSLTFSGYQYLTDISPLHNDWYHFSNKNSEKPYVDTTTKLAAIALSVSASSSAADQGESLLKAAAGLLGIGLPFTYSGLEAVLEKIDAVQAQVVGSALPNPLALYAIALAPQRLPIPGQASVIRFLYDGVTLTSGHLASGSKSVIPAEGSGGFVTFWGSRVPSIVPRIGGLHVMGPSQLSLAPNASAPQLPKSVRYTAVLSGEFSNPKCHWTVLDSNGQHYVGATYSMTETGPSLEVTFTKPGQATIEVDVTDDVGTLDANHAPPRATVATSVFAYPPPPIDQRFNPRPTRRLQA